MTLVAAILCASVCVLAGRLALRERRRALLAAGVAGGAKGKRR